MGKLFGCGTRVGGGSDPDDMVAAGLYEKAGSITEHQNSAGDRENKVFSDENLNEEEQSIASEEDDGQDRGIISDVIGDQVGEMVADVIESDTFQPNIASDKMNHRDSSIEISKHKLSDLDTCFTGIVLMKDQLELIMEQLLLLTHLTLSKKPDSQRVQQLLDLTQMLRAARNEDSSIKGSNRFDLSKVYSLDWTLSELGLDDEISEDVLEAADSCTKQDPTTVISSRISQSEVDGCLCYSPGRMLDQLMELKGDFCLLTNKVNELSASLMSHERHQTMTRIQELQENIRETRTNISKMKEQQELDKIRLTNNTLNMEAIKRGLDELMVGKIDKSEVEILLADKVDYNQLQKKVSLDQMLEVQCRLDKKFKEILRQLAENEKKLEMSVETLQETLGLDAIKGIFKTFRQEIENEIRSLRDLLQQYVDSTNDDCAAAGARIKVLQNLACLSCDSNCVMHKLEKSKVAKLPSVHVTPSVSPLITYELGSIRKSGFNLGRHAGGSHTTSTARERVEKVFLQKNN